MCREDDPNFRDDLSQDLVLLKPRLLELSPPVNKEAWQMFKANILI